MGELSSEELEKKELAFFVCSIIGGIGSLTVMIMFSCYRELRSFAYRLILYISIGDFGVIFFNLFSPYRDMSEAECYVQAIGTSFFDLMTLFWIDITAGVIYMAVIKKKDVVKYERILFIGVLVVSAIFTVLPLSTESYGLSLARYCWITTANGDEDAAFAWQIIQFYGPLWMSIAFTTFVYASVINTIRKKSNETRQDIEKLKAVRRLILFPIIIAVAWTFATINRVQKFVDPSNPSFTLGLLHVIFANLKGLFNCLAYGINRKVIGTVKESLNNRCGCFSKQLRKKKLEELAMRIEVKL